MNDMVGSATNFVANALICSTLFSPAKVTISVVGLIVGSSCGPIKSGRRSKELIEK